MKLTDLESALDEQIEKIQKTEVKECPIPRCSASFFNEYAHRWDFHPEVADTGGQAQKHPL